MSVLQRLKVALRGNPDVGATPDNATNLAARQAPSGRIAAPRPPLRQSIGNVRYAVPPSRAFTPTSMPGGGGPGNLGTGQNATTRTQPRELDVQPSWHYESQYEYFGHATPSSTPHLAGIRANDFRTLGDQFGGRQ